jgi:hypothetical protein
VATRELLALSKIEEFAAWAETQGFNREKPRGYYEVLRLRITGQPPLIFFTRLTTLSGGTPQHATSQSEGTKLVHRWLRSRKEASNV